MLIAATALSPYLDNIEAGNNTEIDVRRCDGTLWRRLTAPAVRVLADGLFITGRGTRSRLKGVFLTTDNIDAVELAMERGLRTAAVRGRLAQSEASRTGMWDSWSNHIGTVTVFKHVRNQYFPQQVLVGRGA